jgi:hypothetical protein
MILILFIFCILKDKTFIALSKFRVNKFTSANLNGKANLNLMGKCYFNQFRKQKKIINNFIV